jgi:uncharacterized protein (TIGR00369 family)
MSPEKTSKKRTRSPASELIGRKILEAGPDGVRVSYRARKGFYNRRGTIMGGFIAAMLDSALGIAAAAALGPGVAPVTVEIKVNYLRPVAAGTLVAEARLVHAGRSLAFMEASLRNGDGDLLATATSTARLVRSKA